MIYLFYPYFWGTKFFWLFKMRLDEVDPLFKDFLKAGEALGHRARAARL